MKELIQQCDELIAELKKFSKEIIDLGKSISDDRFEIFEKSIGFQLPIDFKYILTKYNGISLLGTEVLALDKLQSSSLSEIYTFEHHEAGNPMPLKFLPFSPDGYGNHYCLDLSNLKDGLCPVVFWQHDTFMKAMTKQRFAI
ncbi:MAG: SMI1/KNR4 family protein [Mucilaginibacter sp.]|uniref:SMI1/KNR4 family protein n=1 Tax=Mucilaginibacter sp. TaxID=1882438 RepID=UPI0032640273